MWSSQIIWSQKFFWLSLWSIILSKVVRISLLQKSELWFFMHLMTMVFFLLRYLLYLHLVMLFLLTLFRSHPFREINTARKQLLLSCWVVVLVLSWLQLWSSILHYNWLCYFCHLANMALRIDYCYFCLYK